MYMTCVSYMLICIHVHALYCMYMIRTSYMLIALLLPGWDTDVWQTCLHTRPEREHIRTNNTVLWYILRVHVYILCLSAQTDS